MEPLHAELLTRLCQGDQEAFREVFAPSLDACFSLAVSECRGDDALATEITRAGFLLAWSRVRVASRVIDPADFGIWLLAVVRYEGRNQMSKVKKSRDLEMSTSQPTHASSSDLRGLINTAFIGMTSNEREILDLTVRQGLDAEAALRVTGNSWQKSRGANELIAEVQEKFAVTVAASVLFDQESQCSERDRDVGSDRGLNPLTRQRLMRHLRRCSTCGAALDVASDAIANLGLPMLVAPRELRAELFQGSPHVEAPEVNGGIASGRAFDGPTDGHAGDVSYLGLGATGIAPLSVWEQAKRLDKARAPYRADGWPPAKLPGRLRRLIGKATG